MRQTVFTVLVFTLAIISTFLGYYLYKTFRSLVIEPYGSYIGAFISSWLTLLITAITVCVMLYISGIDSLAVTLGPMVGPHVLAGIMEGLISMLLLALICKISPGFLAISSGNEEKIKNNKNIRSEMIRISIFLLILALIIGRLISGSLGVIFTFLLCWGIGISLTAGVKINEVEAHLAEVLSP